MTFHIPFLSHHYLPLFISLRSKNFHAQMNPGKARTMASSPGSGYQGRYLLMMLLIEKLHAICSPVKICARHTSVSIGGLSMFMGELQISRVLTEKRKEWRTSGSWQELLHGKRFLLAIYLLLWKNFWKKPEKP